MRRSGVQTGVVSESSAGDPMKGKRKARKKEGAQIYKIGQSGKVDVGGGAGMRCEGRCAETVRRQKKWRSKH